MAKALGWKNIPEELKQLRQWCVSNHTHPDPHERKAPRIPRAKAPRASILNLNDWGTFDEAAQYAWDHGPSDWCIGFVLTKEDPYCVIDLDVKTPETHPDKPHLWTTQEEAESYWRVAQEANSYVEVSIGGRSLHVIVKANIGEGVHARGIEIYSQERYVICTGNVKIDKPVREAQSMMEASVRNLRKLSKETKIDLVETDPVDTDEEVYQKALNASNGQKFLDLCNGEWAKYGYPSQSEADLSLMSMLAFYSQSNEQCRRLFRCTKLGAREKAQKNDVHLNRCLSLIRGRQERDAQTDFQIIQQQAEMLARVRAESAQTGAPSAPIAAESHAPATTPAPQATPGPTAPQGGPVQHEGITPISAHALAVEKEMNRLGRLNGSIVNGHDTLDKIPWPPGVVGELAKFIYCNAHRPVREVAIVAAFGFMAGVCGKTFTISDTGLNIYFILVALSSIGKEAMHSGISSILDHLRNSNPTAMRFVDYSVFASGPALRKACLVNPSFVNVSGEWGRTVKRMSEENGRDPSMASLRTAMTDLFHKSGPTSIVGGIAYSRKEDSVVSVSGVAYSLIGETTPTTYYESLTESMMEDGFMSRFASLEYSGLRPPLNENRLTTLGAEFGDYISRLCTFSLSRLTGLKKGVQVQLSDEADTILREFDVRCDREINNRTKEAWRQMWNRAHLKALRFAALMAAADNYENPVVTKDHANWAIDLILRDIDLMSRKLTSGDIGMGDDTREVKLLSVLREYVQHPQRAYRIPEELRVNGIVPRRYLQTRCSRVNCFYKHRMGATSSLDATIRSLTDSGYLREIGKDELEEFGYQGRCYRIMDLPQLLQQS